MNELELRRTAERARQMREWSENAGGLFEVFSAVRADYLKTLTGSEITETALREQVYHRIAALDDIRLAMDLVISEGAGAEAQIELLSQSFNRKKARA